MKPVAMITPEPKYFATKNASFGTPTLGRLEANVGNHAPKKDPTKITKIADMRRPKRPSNSFSVAQVGGVASDIISESLFGF